MRHTETPRVLIVDDDPVTSRLIGGFFETQGLASVSAVRTLADAGHAITTTAFRAIITDLHLPDGNGMELVHLVRRGPRSRNRDSTVIVCSAYANEGAATLLRRLGADAVLGKPADPPALMDLLCAHDEVA